MNTYLLTISTPDGNALSEQVCGLYVRGADGDLAVLAGHVPFMTTVRKGACKVEFPDGTERTAHLSGGLLTVASEGVTLLSGTFAWD